MSVETLCILSLAPSLLIIHITLYACQLLPKLMECDTCTHMYHIIFMHKLIIFVHVAHSLSVCLYIFAQILSLFTRAAVTGILP